MRKILTVFILIATALAGGFLAVELRGLVISKTAAPAPAVSSETPFPCTGSDQNNYLCYSKYFSEIVAKSGPEAAIAEIKKLYPTNAYVISDCHELMHVIGRAAVRKYPTISEAFKHGNDFCASGYYHGILEGYAAEVGKENLSAHINDICSGIPGKDRYSLAYYNCVHGLGHGIMSINNDEVFDSLAVCDKLNGAFEQSSCYSGVFMENVIADGVEHVTKYLKPSDPLYPCNAVDFRYQDACYRIQSSYFLKIIGNDYPKIFALCEKADPREQNTCFESIGRDVSGGNVSDNQAVLSICGQAKKSAEILHCMIGAARDRVYYYHSGDLATRLCSLLTGTDRSSCQAAVDNDVRQF